MNALRPYTFALVVVCVVAAGTVLQLQQLLRSSCASNLSQQRQSPEPTNEASPSFEPCCTCDSSKVGSHSPLRLGLIIQAESFALSRLKRTDQAVKRAVCDSPSLMSIGDRCSQRLVIHYYVATDRPFLSHERVHKLPSLSLGPDESLPSTRWFRRNLRYFSHMDAVAFEGSPDQPAPGLAPLRIISPSGASELFGNSTSYLMPLSNSFRRTDVCQICETEAASLSAANRPARSAMKGAVPTAANTSAAPTRGPAERVSWLDTFVSVLDELVFGFDLESAEALGYGEESDSQVEPTDASKGSHTRDDSEPKLASMSDMSGDQFQWLLRVVVMVAWLHMFWDQL